MNKSLIPLLLLLSSVSFASTPFSSSLSVGLTHDDNITNAKRNFDIQSDQILSLSATGTYTYTINGRSNLIFGGTLQHEHYLDFDKLSNNELSFQATYQIQPQRQFTSPWYIVSVRTGLIEYDSDFRDGDYMEFSLGMGKRLTDKTSLNIGYVTFSSSADSSYHEADYDRLYCSLDFKLDQRNTLYTTLSYYTGDIISTSFYDGSSYAYNLTGLSHTGDDAYSANSPWTYKLDADTYSLGIGDNFALSSHQAIDAEIKFYQSDASYGFTYDRMIITLFYLHRF